MIRFIRRTGNDITYVETKNGRFDITEDVIFGDATGYEEEVAIIRNLMNIEGHGYEVYISK
ncbi:hypothetical protein L0Y26_09290 [Pectobacterium aroidearum]|uniref:hypothetical protein n=1 Tax=Pectobacterium aroidearum TaxID=1201031 RepID=UPI00211521C3|nr:hypothetical protein [Pectobacterium aroidearum]UUE38085.1 hypothetical protein L0Y26_09290 [Pectobacterium aroidearum]UUE42460.1 hypothetical protein L0Y25_09290 [Pectobacterium aroidearum]